MTRTVKRDLETSTIIITLVNNSRSKNPKHLLMYKRSNKKNYPSASKNRRSSYPYTRREKVATTVEDVFAKPASTPMYELPPLAPMNSNEFLMEYHENDSTEWMLGNDLSSIDGLINQTGSFLTEKAVEAK